MGELLKDNFSGETRPSDFFRGLNLTDDEYSCLSIINSVLKYDCVIPEYSKYLDTKDDPEYYDLSYEYKNYSVKQLKNIINYIYNGDLKNEYFFKSLFDEEDSYIDELNKKIFNMLQDEVLIQKLLDYLVMRLHIVKNITLGGDNTYTMLPRCKQERSAIGRHVTFDVKKPKSILLVADTHIGNPDMEDLELLQNVIDYSISEFETEECIHLGDVFEGVRLDKGKYVNHNQYDEVIRNINYKQLKKFYDCFPENIKVVVNAGNHDEYMNQFLKQTMVGINLLNYNALSILKPNFHLLVDYEFGHTFKVSNLGIKINHHFTYNMFEPYVKTYEIDAPPFFENFRKYNCDNVDLYIFGHFHEELHRTVTDNNGVTKREYEVVPSTSKMNIGKDVAKILLFDYDDKDNVIGYKIVSLKSDESKRISVSKVDYYESNRTLVEKKK